jgi:hypothetical protein
MTCNEWHPSQVDDVFNISSGLIRFNEQTIYLRDSKTENMIHNLLHEMCHAATSGDHDDHGWPR